MSEPLVTVVGLDHVVLVVRDVERSLRWYHDVLGLAVERLGQWRSGQAPFPSLRVDPTTIIDLLEGDPDGVNVDHIALVVDDADLEALVASDRVEVVMGPARLSGAQGEGTGVYLCDPDGHRVELRTYR